MTTVLVDWSKFDTQIFATMLPPEIINRICDFLTVDAIGTLTKTSRALGDVIHESSYHSAVLREHPHVDSFEKTWTSWKDLVLNIATHSGSWYPNNSCDYSSDDYSDDSEQAWVHYNSRPW